MPLKDIKGQEQALTILRDSLKQDRLAHAYLFLGPRGTGKAKASLEFAKLINCQRGESDCCNSCPSCITINNLSNPDLFFISREAARQIPINKIRQLQQRLSLKPFSARWKVAIIADAEDMTEEACNCLLKTLEEPAPQTLFILTAANQNRFPRTVLSRCQIIRFRPLARDEVVEILANDFSIEREEARFLAAISSANLEKALAFRQKGGLAWKNRVIDEFIKGPFDGDKDFILTEKKDTQIEAMDVLSNFYRDLLVYKLTKEDGLLINIDRIDEIRERAPRSGAEALCVYIREVAAARASLAANANTRLTIKYLEEKLRAQYA